MHAAKLYFTLGWSAYGLFTTLFKGRGSGGNYQLRCVDWKAGYASKEAMIRKIITMAALYRVHSIPAQKSLTVQSALPGWGLSG